MGLADFIKNRIQVAPNCLMLPLLHLNKLGDKVYGRKAVAFKHSIPDLDPDKMLVDMANYAIAHVPYYRNRYKDSVIKSVDDFKSTFGFLDKAEVMSHFDDFISDEADKIPHVTLSTSGTSGQPLRLLMPADRYVTEMSFLGRFMESCGWDYGIKASIRRKQLPDKRDFMVNPVTKEIIFDGYRTDRDYIGKMYKLIKKHGVKTLYGYSSSVTQILHLMVDDGFDVSFLKRVILTSEPVTKAQYSFIEDRLGLKVIAYYGHTEKLILIGLYDRDTLAIEPGYGYTEIIGEDGNEVAAGEEGELVGSTFYNRVMPLLRYRTGDYTRPTGRKITVDGIEKPLVAYISGRRDKSIIYRHDGTHTVATAFEIHDERQMSFEAIQYVQDKLGYMRVLVVKGSNYNPDDEAFMIKHYGKAMLGEEYVTIEYVDKLITQPNGKTLTIINNTL
ncbi:MAG: hypothetical protein K2L97_01730 [Muribaculaceae bacterium]|nr:hypothetical protein [Muribaculaceae bacterium]